MMKINHIALSRKVNLGNFETMDASVNIGFDDDDKDFNKAKDTALRLGRELLIDALDKIRDLK